MKTGLRCANLARSRDFYTRILGFTVVEEWKEPNGRGCILSPFETANSPCLEIYPDSLLIAIYQESSTVAKPAADQAARIGPNGGPAGHEWRCGTQPARQVQRELL
jgi:catechol 2,3-dioxygenase-like lactoylglutathione lyase family enzyme